MVSTLPKYTLTYKLINWRLPVLLKHFKKHEGKDYENEDDITQCKTQYGLYLYGQITLLHEIINKEI